jgi:hypothetical protein
MRGGRDVLRAPQPREALAAATAGVQRVVLLGDVVEFRQGPVREALAAAEGPLRALGAALAAGGGPVRVTIVPGNHDHRLLVPWLERRARDRSPAALGLAAAVDWRAGEPLARLAAWLAPRGSGIELDVAYPGCWLRDDVYATHGHYSDRHATVPMFERLGAGAMARLAGEGPAGPQSAEDYEAILGPIYAWLDALAQGGGPRLGGGPRPGAGTGGEGASTAAWRALAGSDRRGARRRALAAAFPLVVAALNRAGLGPLSADLSATALRRARLAALGEVVLRLAVPARHVIFGHTHRAGPLPTDDPAQWRTVTAATLTNTGCWVRDPSVLGGEPSTSPYRPGFAVTIDADPRRPPALVNLLD